jgi:DNA-binding response OmpR family regulator
LAVLAERDREGCSEGVGPGGVFRGLDAQPIPDAGSRCADRRDRESAREAGATKSPEAPVKVNPDQKTTTIGGNRVHLTGKEYGLLELLALRKGTMLTKEMILNHLYGGMDEPELKIIDVFICKLRRKLANASGGKNYIETVWGRSYALKEGTPEMRAIAG